MAFEHPGLLLQEGVGPHGFLMSPPLSALVSEAAFIRELPPAGRGWGARTQCLPHCALLPSSLSCRASGLCMALGQAPVGSPMEPSLEGWCEAAF